MDVFYEESSIAKNEAKGKRKYKIANILSNVFLVIGILLLFFTLNIPVDGIILWLFICSWFFVCWFVLVKFRNRFNVSYDYAFVSGELRIAKVININKRKFVARIQAEDIIQLGDVENTSYDNLQADPGTKTIACTSNNQPEVDKFFMYILVNDNGKKLYILECRETLLMHILKFVKRTTLESDYVSQERKKQQKQV
jgi:hypothetical protein